MGLFFGSLGNSTTGNVVKKNTITANGFHEYVAAGDPEPHVRNGEEVANSGPPGPTGYAQFTHRKGNGIVVFGPNANQNATANVIGGRLVTDTADGNLVCGNAANGILVNGGAKPTGSPTTGPAADKNIIRHNTSGGGATTPTQTPPCAPNDVEDPPAPGAAFDFHDGNNNANVAAGGTGCESNIWSNNKDLDGVTPDPDRTKFPSCID